MTFAIDDTPTERYGRHVQGAGVHHNPSPGPAGGPFVYGHVWVVLGLLARHPAWGTVALPLLSRLYVRQKSLGGIARRDRPAFRTKLDLAADLVRWAVRWLGFLGKPLWVVADGAYAKAAFLRPVRSLGVTVVSRLRRDASLRTVPGPRRPGQRGRTRVYGAGRIDLAKRAGQRRGWVTGAFTLYGTATEKRYKTFVATWRPAGGAIRVVLVDEPSGWTAFFCTDPTATVADILGCVADRFSLETCFRDCKEVVGAGQQQVRLVRASVGGVPPVPLDLHPDRGVGVEPGRGRVGRASVRLAVGRRPAAAESRGQAAGVATGTAGRGNPRGSTPGTDRAGTPGRRRTPAQPGGLTLMMSRKRQINTRELVRPAGWRAAPSFF